MTKSLVPIETIENKICIIRGYKIMLDSDLAALYQVPTFRLNEAVKRNIKRFPKDFMFQLTIKEADYVLRSRSQFAILNRGQNIKYLPYTFTEHGVAMLSSVLKSDRAIEMNILIIRAFITLRKMLAAHKNLAQKIAKLDNNQKKQGQQLASVYAIVKQIINPPLKPKRKIGFVSSEGNSL